MASNLLTIIVLLPLAGAVVLLIAGRGDKPNESALKWTALLFSLTTFVVSLALPLGFLGGRTGAIAAVMCWGAGLGVQDASLRAGIAQVVSMNKRGSAFGSFNAVYGVMWFAGSAAMGLLYDHSLMGLVVFGVVAQLIAAVMFASSTTWTKLRFFADVSTGT